MGTPPRARGRLPAGYLDETDEGNTPACAGKTDGFAFDGPRFREHPPRARGRPHKVHDKECGGGNTPACAGKTEATLSWDARDGEHPRVRGEDVSTVEAVTVTTGTPPRARGRHRIHNEEHFREGNTPACAGKTSIVTKNEATSWEHPRVRGEDMPKLHPGPATRGRPRVAASDDQERGNTPACAGKTHGGQGGVRITREHPRVRGEDMVRYSSC